MHAVASASFLEGLPLDLISPTVAFLDARSTAALRIAGGRNVEHRLRGIVERSLEEYRRDCPPFGNGRLSRECVPPDPAFPIAVALPGECCRADFADSVSSTAALRAAAAAEDLTKIRLLLQDYRPRAMPQLGSEFLRVAVMRGHLAMTEAFLTRIDPAAGDNDAVMRAALWGYYDVLELLLRQPGVNPCDRNGLALVAASSEGHFRVLLRLLSMCGPVPLEVAKYAIARRDDPLKRAVVEAILSVGLRDGEQGQWPLRHVAVFMLTAACFFEDVSTLEILLTRTEVDAVMISEMHVAVAAEAPKLIDILATLRAAYVAKSI